MLRFLFAIFVFCVVALATVFAGPIVSGAALLLLPSRVPSAPHDLPESYEPLHKGYVDLSTGLYVREDEDLVLRGTPPLILRRTYLSGYRMKREFGIGTTHDGEWMLIGEAGQYQSVSLVLATGSRIDFERISRGTSHHTALFVHRGTPSETKHTFSEGGYSTSEVWGGKGFEPVSLTYDLDPLTNRVTALTVTCTGRTGHPLKHSSGVRPGYEEWVKWDLFQTHCGSGWRSRQSVR